MSGVPNLSALPCDVNREWPILIELAGPPRGKERVKTAAAGHSYTPERTVSFESRLALRAADVMAGRMPLDGALYLEVFMFMPIAKSKPRKWRAAALAGEIRPTVKPDWDNGGKLTDALNGIVWFDDSQIVDGHVLQFYSERPRTVVRVKPAPIVAPPEHIGAYAPAEDIFA